MGVTLASLLMEIEKLRLGLGALEQDVNGHDKDLYRGDRENPGLTIRIASNEKDIQTLHEDIKAVNGSVKQIRSDLKKIVWLVLAAVIGEVIKLILAKG